MRSDGFSPAYEAPSAAAAEPPGVAPGKQLALYFRGQRHELTDRFVIGRGSKGVDLTIRDPNVSRQHCMVEKTQGQFFIVDMGSTNGVEFNGQRVQRKALYDGERYDVCGHEIRFALE